MVVAAIKAIAISVINTLKILFGMVIVNAAFFTLLVFVSVPWGAFVTILALVAKALGM